MSNGDRALYQGNTTTDSTFLRGIVVDRIDPIMEGRVAITIPRLMHEGDPAGLKFKKKTINVNTDFLENNEISELVNTNVESSNAIWARPVKTESGRYKIPYVGQTIYVFMEDGDPSKTYYMPFGPTIQGDNPEMYFVKAVSDVYTPDKKPNIHLFEEFHDKTAIYYNENTETREYRVNLPNGSFLSISENETATQIEIQTSGKQSIVIDDTNKKITVTTASGHGIIMDDGEKTGVYVKTSGGSSVDMSGDGSQIKLTNSGGAVTDMKGSVITSTAGGGKIVIGNGKVSLN